MKKTFILFLLACCLTNVTFAQYGFVAVDYDDADTRSASSVGQLFTRGVEADGYANEGLQQSFLYRGTDTLLHENSSYPVAYRPGRVPQGEPQTVEVGETLVYLPPTQGIDSLIDVMAYGVIFTNDTTVVAPYSVCEHNFELYEPVVLPAGSVPPVQYYNNKPAAFPVGVVTPVRWDFGVADKTLADTQLVNVKFPPCGTDNYDTDIANYPYSTTLPDPLVATDYEGNDYNTVRVDCHCWTKENLQSKEYADGAKVAHPMSYVSYEHPDSVANVTRYGYLYTWNDAVRAPLAPDADGYVQGVCPDGWRVPTAEEFDLLSSHSALDLMSTSDWLLDEGTDITGFTALPAGRFTGFRFENLLGETHFWSITSVSASVARCCSLLFGCKDVLQFEINTKNGLSVRCLKN